MAEPTTPPKQQQRPQTTAAHPLTPRTDPKIKITSSECTPDPANRRRVAASNNDAAGVSGSPFPPPGTPRTPGNAHNRASCTTDESAFTVVAVHTAKCTECDRRNKAVMRRCPGCTFQVCTPCYEKREREGRGLRHGLAMSGPGSPATARTVRNRVSSSTLAGGADRMGELKGEGEAVAVEAGVKEAEKEQVKAKKSAASKKRVVSKQQTAAHNDDFNVSSKADDLEESETTATSKKRRRCAPTMDDLLPEATAPKRAARKAPAGASRPLKRTNPPSSPEATSNAQTCSRVRAEDMSIDDLMRSVGLNTAENPYHEHLLGRRQPFLSNPPIRIPDIVQRNFKPRPTALEIQRSFQDKVRKKLQEQERMRKLPVGGHDEAAGMVQPEGTEALKNDAYVTRSFVKAEGNEAPKEDAHTVRAFVETEAAMCRQTITMSGGEHESLTGALTSAALSWSTTTYNELSPEEQELTRPGLEMRLDLVDAEYTSEFALLLGLCATEMLRAMGKIHRDVGA